MIDPEKNFKFADSPCLLRTTRLIDEFERRMCGQSVEADGHFKSVPDVRSELFDLTQTGPHVSFREQATWTAKDGARRSQSSLGVYEVRDGKIKRAWHFSAARESTPASSK